MWPWNNQGIASPNLNVTPQQRQYFSGDAEIFEPDANLMGQVPSHTPYRDYSNYEDLIQNPENNPNRLQNLERFVDNRFTGDENVPGIGKKAIDYIDAPVDFMMRANHPTRFDPAVNLKNFAQELPGKIKSGITGLLDNTLMGRIMGSFKRPEQMDQAYQAITGSADDQGYGKYKGNEYRIDDNKIYSELFPGGKNFDSWLGSGSIEEMEMDPNKVGSVGWAQERLQNKKKISKRLHGILQNRGIDKGGNFINRPTNEGAQFGTPVAIPSAPIQPNIPHDRGGATPTPQSWNRDQGGGYTTARGFTKADTGGRGHHGGWKADGGRIGYQGGELVEQETDFIEGPQGGEEFQETVVEGQEQPSREQLEALAMEIFQLPLEELDEQQLLVVYQEAMQGQPMEEAVQEEDVQFAAQGGLAGLL